MTIPSYVLSSIQTLLAFHEKYDIVEKQNTYDIRLL